MGRFFTLTSSLGQERRGLRKKTMRGMGLKIGPVSLCAVTIVLVFLLSLFYITQSNKISTEGYEIRALEDRLSTLRAESRKLELKAAQLQSVKYIEEEVKQINMVPLANVVYLSAQGSAVALGE